MSDQPPSRTLDKFVLRLPDGMRDRLAVRAEVHNRSMNAEIIQMLSSVLDVPAAVELRTRGEEWTSVSKELQLALKLVTSLSKRQRAIELEMQLKIDAAKKAKAPAADDD